MSTDLPTKLYRVERTSPAGDGQVVYDANHVVIVMASDKRRAREIASQVCQDEGPDIWQDEAAVTVTELGVLTPVQGAGPVIVVEDRDG